ncbi:hypothetical protein [Aquabacterium sp.]|uniref:hypothetical protein n=1 Tax=Aquabacterium sp. TaxID=1872578 RepID=UPI0024892597|nr:hypothetical protein [Aquabacterium sp.]MDI1260278.1 hypothetical protein [Aquabacterium sp.]
MNMSNADQSTELTASEVVQLVTHYGNMRFAMFTVFSAILGALISFPFSAGGQVFFRDYPQFRALLGISGLVLSLMFTLAEGRIACLLYVYQHDLYTRSEALKPGWNIFWAFFASITMAAPLVLSALFWLSYWLSDLQIPLAPGVK